MKNESILELIKGYVDPLLNEIEKVNSPGNYRICIQYVMSGLMYMWVTSCSSKD